MTFFIQWHLKLTIYQKARSGLIQVIPGSKRLQGVIGSTLKLLGRSQEIKMKIYNKPNLIKRGSLYGK